MIQKINVSIQCSAHAVSQKWKFLWLCSYHTKVRFTVFNEAPLCHSTCTPVVMRHLLVFGGAKVWLSDQGHHVSGRLDVQGRDTRHAPKKFVEISRTLGVKITLFFFRFFKNALRSLIRELSLIRCRRFITLHALRLANHSPKISSAEGTHIRGGGSQC